MVLVAVGKHLRTHFPKFKIFIRLLLVTAFIGFAKEALHSFADLTSQTYLSSVPAYPDLQF
jgi:hypothetical protein